MARLTTDNPNNNLQSILNLFYVKDHEAYVRGGGPAPDFKDISLNDFARRIAERYHLDIPESDVELPDAMFEHLVDGIDTMDGILALIYNAGWAFAEIRHRLSECEDILGDTYDLDHLRELLAAEKEGRLFIQPNLCKPGDILYIVGYLDSPADAEILGPYPIVRTTIENIYYDNMSNSPKTIIRFMGVEWSEIGKSVFLTREEAEAALAKIQEDNHEQTDL